MSDSRQPPKRLDRALIWSDTHLASGFFRLLAAALLEFIATARDYAKGDYRVPPVYTISLLFTIVSITGFSYLFGFIGNFWPFDTGNAYADCFAWLGHFIPQFPGRDEFWPLVDGIVAMAYVCYLIDKDLAMHRDWRNPDAFSRFTGALRQEIERTNETLARVQGDSSPDKSEQLKAAYHRFPDRQRDSE